MREIHIIAGLLALIAGAIALYATKGQALHRRSGTLFVVAMLVMTCSAAIMAQFISPNRGNVAAASLTFYLVCSGWLSVKRRLDEARLPTIGLTLLAAMVSVYSFSLGIEALGNPRGLLDGIPAPALFMFGTVALIGVTMDLRLLHAGNIHGGHRLARHLWRMGFAMWIATMSFFLGQAKFFPEPIRKSGILAIPVLLVLILMLYWLARVLLSKRSLPTRRLASAQE